MCLFNSIIFWSFLSLKRYLFDNLQAFYRNLCSWALFYKSLKSVFYSYPDPLHLTFKFECNLYLKLTCYIYFLYKYSWICILSNTVLQQASSVRQYTWDDKKIEFQALLQLLSPYLDFICYLVIPFPVSTSYYDPKINFSKVIRKTLCHMSKWLANDLWFASQFGNKWVPSH